MTVPRKKDRRWLKLLIVVFVIVLAAILVYALGSDPMARFR